MDVKGIENRQLHSVLERIKNCFRGSLNERTLRLMIAETVKIAQAQVRLNEREMLVRRMVQEEQESGTDRSFATQVTKRQISEREAEIKDLRR